MTHQLDASDSCESAQATLHAHRKIEKKIKELRTLFEELGIYDKIRHNFTNNDPLGKLESLAKKALNT